jgi:hypothetical protein
VAKGAGISGIRSYLMLLQVEVVLRQISAHAFHRGARFVNISMIGPALRSRKVCQRVVPVLHTRKTCGICRSLRLRGATNR